MVLILFEVFLFFFLMEIKQGQKFRHKDNVSCLLTTKKAPLRGAQMPIFSSSLVPYLSKSQAVLCVVPSHI